MGRARYSHLLEDPEVRRWYENVARGSRLWADVCLRRLGSFCAELGMAPRDLAGLPDRRLHQVLLDFVSAKEREGYAGSYIACIMKSVRSWLSFNMRRPEIKIKIRGAQDTPTLRNERIPTREELRRIFLSADKKTRVACALVAHAGLRIQTIGNYEGKDGLRLKDLPELTVKGRRVSFRKIPTLIVVRRELSKAGHQYLTFLSREGCEYLRDYLEERLASGERLGPESAVVTPKVRIKPFIRANNIGDDIRKAIRTAGFPWRPYVLRSYFDTQLMQAESRGLVLRDYRQFWMGHRGDIEARYTTNKGMLPQEVIEDMREAYKRSQRFLQTVETEEEVRLEPEFRRQLLLASGFKSAEVERMDLERMGEEEFQELI
ncbi:MAG: hypothetical protein QXH26_05100 [Candidatus Hadarchaeales archaeon]